MDGQPEAIRGAWQRRGAVLTLPEPRSSWRAQPTNGRMQPLHRRSALCVGCRKVSQGSFVRGSADGKSHLNFAALPLLDLGTAVWRHTFSGWWLGLGATA